MAGWTFNLFAPEWSWGGFSWDPRGEDYTGFKSKRGDKLNIYMSDFEYKKIGIDLKKVKFTSAFSKKDLNKSSKSDVTFIYDAKSGKLYFNGNGKEKGFSLPYTAKHDGETRKGTYGGILARLKKGQQIEDNNLNIICSKKNSNCYESQEEKHQKQGGATPTNDSKSPHKKKGKKYFLCLYLFLQTCRH